MRRVPGTACVRSAGEITHVGRTLVAVMEVLRAMAAIVDEYLLVMLSRY